MTGNKADKAQILKQVIWKWMKHLYLYTIICWSILFMYGVFSNGHLNQQNGSMQKLPTQQIYQLFAVGGMKKNMQTQWVSR